MEREVGPAHYRNVTLDELCVLLGRDHDIPCWVQKERGETRVDFEIPYSMPRQAVLAKLANEADLELFLQGCGNGASLLKGVEPYGYLIEKSDP